MAAWDCEHKNSAVVASTARSPRSLPSRLLANVPDRSPGTDEGNEDNDARNEQVRVAPRRRVLRKTVRV